jgi:hypothetical protein
VPETTFIDRGRAFVPEAFLAAFDTPGMSMQPTPPRSPTAKGSVEGLRRHQHTLRTARRRLDRFPRPSGSKAVEDEARFTMAELQELLDKPVAACRQHAPPHDGPPHPVLPEKALAPSEMRGALRARPGTCRGC